MIRKTKDSYNNNQSLNNKPVRPIKNVSTYRFRLFRKYKKNFGICLKKQFDTTIICACISVFEAFVATPFGSGVAVVYYPAAAPHTTRMLTPPCPGQDRHFLGKCQMGATGKNLIT